MKRHFMRKAAAVALLLGPMGAALVSQPAAAQHFQYQVAQAERGQISNMSLNSNGNCGRARR